MKKLWNEMKKNPDVWIFRAVLVAFVATMLPLLYLSRYTVPGCDDYTYGIKTHGAYLASGSLIAVLKAALSTTIEYWYNWQGTYASIFLMTLSPGIMNEKWYFLTTFIMSGMVIFSVGALVSVILKKYVQETTFSQRAACVLILSFLSLQTMVAPSDGLYWYNGALHYVFMESVLFFQMAVLLSWLRAEKKGVRAGLLLLACALSFVLGGANLITGLQSCILLVFLVLYCIWKKEKRHALVLLPFFINIAGFMLNVAAPGNYVREGTAEGMGALKAVILSFYWAIVFVVEWLEPIVIIGFVAMCPVLWKICEKTKKYFTHPIILLALSYCVFAAMFTPTLFATSSEGPDRCKNIMRIALYVMIFINLANDLGYLANKEKTGFFTGVLHSMKKVYLPFVMGCLTVMAVMFFFTADKNTYTSVSALRSIANGEASTYYEENAERLALYNDPDLKTVEVTPLSARPHLLFKADVGNEGSQDYWISISIREYYQKEGIYLKE